jgi:Septum formation
MERICDSCGADPGAGAFCQHCGARLPGDAPPAPVAPTPTTAPVGATPPTPPPPAPPAPTPPLISGQPAKRSGCRSAFLIVGVVALVVLVVGGFFVWRFVNDEVLPGIQGAVDDFSTFSEAPPGPCYDLDAESGLLVGWTEVSCSGSHQVEVSFAATFNEGPFPGDEYLSNQAINTCTAAFERYVGITPERSTYNSSWLVPTEDMWADGARQGICLVVADDGSFLSGTVKGSES